MKIFIHTGKGHYIGSVVVVAAEDIGKAFFKVREYLDGQGLVNEKIEITEKQISEEETTIIYSQNGDY